MNAADRLAKIQARADKATPGVWKIWGMQVMSDQKGTSNVDDAVLVSQTFLRNEEASPRTFDAQFIAQAHQDVPALVAALQAVLGLHQPTAGCGEPGACETCCAVCETCRYDYPCPTVRAVEDALGEVQR